MPRYLHQTSRRAVPALIGVVALLAVSSCGDDDASATADDVAGRTFVSTAVEGATLVDATEVSITFEQDTMSANAGCNTLTGGYAIDDGVLSAETLGQTMMACEPPLEAQDQWLTALLTGRPTIGVDGDTLTVSDDDITLTLAEG